MESLSLKKDKRGVFGLDGVLKFFAIALTVTLLAFISIVILGSLIDTEVGDRDEEKVYVVNETIHNLTDAAGGVATTYATNISITLSDIILLVNSTSLNSDNYTITEGNISASTTTEFNDSMANMSYTATYKNDLLRGEQLANNATSGYAEFFDTLTSAWTILAVMVILLVLIVLIQVIRGRKAGSSGAL